MPAAIVLCGLLLIFSFVPLVNRVAIPALVRAGMGDCAHDPCA